MVANGELDTRGRWRRICGPLSMRQKKVAGESGHFSHSLLAAGHPCPVCHVFLLLLTGVVMYQLVDTGIAFLLLHGFELLGHFLAHLPLAAGIVVQ